MHTIPPTVTPEYLQALERLLAETEKFLRRQSGIGQLRQAMREAEAQAPACEYCGSKPAFSVVWTEDSDEHATFLCPSCDDQEARELEED